MTADPRARLLALEKLARMIAADVKHRDNDLPTVIGRVEQLLAMLYAELPEGQSDHAVIVNAVTAVVREADAAFEKSGGGSRHWTRDWFLPMLNQRGLYVIRGGRG